MKEHSRVALITGANRGLGLEISRQLAGRGLTVLMGARDTSKGVRAVALLNSESLDARQIALDVSSSQSILEAVSVIDGEFGRLDVLVNNAAVLTDIGVQPSETEESMLDLNPERQSNSRLSCQIEVTDALDGLVVQLPEFQF